MDMKKTYSKVEEKLDSDICDLIKKPNMNRDELMMLSQAVDILKDISTIKAMDEYGGNEDEYSSASFASRASNRRSMDYSRGYEDGMSMAQNRSPRTGRFISGDESYGYSEEMSGRRYMDGSRDGYSNAREGSREGGSRDGYSNARDGRSGHSINDRMVDNIERMYDNAETEHERAELKDVINYIRRKSM